MVEAKESFDLDNTSLAAIAHLVVRFSFANPSSYQFYS